MSRPTPIHRDPDEEEDDWGVDGDDNVTISIMVKEAEKQIKAGELATQDEIIDFVRQTLETIDGGCDTVVKENVFQQLGPIIKKKRVTFDDYAIYGW